MRKDKMNSPLLESYSSTQKNTKQWLMRRADKGKNRDGGGKVKKPQQTLWACCADPRVCVKQKHPRIMCAVHGSKEDAERCNKKYLMLLTS